jgi:hypothetical protein
VLCEARYVPSSSSVAYTWAGESSMKRSERSSSSTAVRSAPERARCDPLGGLRVAFTGRGGRRRYTLERLAFNARHAAAVRTAGVSSVSDASITRLSPALHSRGRSPRAPRRSLNVNHHPGGSQLLGEFGVLLAQAGELGLRCRRWFAAPLLVRCRQPIGLAPTAPVGEQRRVQALTAQ